MTLRPIPALAAAAAATLLAAALAPQVGRADNDDAKSPTAKPASAKADGTMLAHMVFFTLKDDSPAEKQRLVDACKTYLTGHPGEHYFSAGVRAPEYDRPVNDTEFDVALHVVFKDKASHDAYQTAERHLEFIAQCKDNWEKVRVFDSVIGE